MLVKGVRGDYNGLRAEVSKVVRVSGEKSARAEQKDGTSETKWLGGEQKSGAVSGKLAKVEQEKDIDGVNGGDLVDKLRVDWPELRFRAGKKFAFRPPRTVVYELADFGADGGGVVDGADFEQNWYNLQLLHEVGHALLGHCEYGADLERLKMERAAWEKARELCGRYGVEYDEEVVEGALDTYRDWLHRRSRCAKCGLTRFQGADGRYQCPGCDFEG